jgi:hypothetical protein
VLGTLTKRLIALILPRLYHRTDRHNAFLSKEVHDTVAHTN